MTNIEIIITSIGFIGSLIAIYEFGGNKFNNFRKKPLTRLMNELADKNTPLKQQKQILRKIKGMLSLTGKVITNKYIDDFNSNGRGKINIFRDICIQNRIEPTRELCIQMLGSDDIQF